METVFIFLAVISRNRPYKVDTVFIWSSLFPWLLSGPGKEAAKRFNTESTEVTESTEEDGKNVAFTSLRSILVEILRRSKPFEAAR